MPKAMNERDVIVVDPMLATCNSAAAAIARITQCQLRSTKFLCLLTCPEGINALHREHPDVPIYTAAIDRDSATTATSCWAWAMRATGFSARSERLSPSMPRALYGASGRWHRL
jgi:Uracil phosphoribosyltransferase